MKEPEISQLAPSASRGSRGPRYRYYSNPPVTVSLRLADLAPQIPEAARLPGFNGEHQVELSCEEIFTGPVPRLPLSRLAEIARQHVRIDGLPDNPINLPVARLTLAYRFVNGRELIEEAPPPEEIKPEESPEAFAPKAESAKAPEDQKSSGDTEKPVTPLSDGPAGGETKETVIGSPLSPGVKSEAGSRSEPSDTIPSSAEAKIGDAPSKWADAPKQELPVQAAQEGAAAEKGKASEPEAWRPITVFPIFRRKVTEPQVKPPVAPLRPIVEARPFAPPEFSTKREQDSQTEPAEKQTLESPLAPTRAEAVLVDAERLPEPKRTVEIVDQEALQAVFMTEEMLSVDRVVELCGGLPGIKSCVLAHGAAVIASHNVPESIDLVSLSAHALEMLAAMRQSAARMGVGAVPAVTIHAEKGPITFFHQDDLCLLVMHKDRGFVPGVREKLQKVVEHLAQSRPALTAEDSHLAGGSRKPAT